MLPLLKAFRRRRRLRAETRARKRRRRLLRACLYGLGPRPRVLVVGSATDPWGTLPPDTATAPSATEALSRFAPGSFDLVVATVEEAQEVEAAAALVRLAQRYLLRVTLPPSGAKCTADAPADLVRRLPGARLFPEEDCSAKGGVLVVGGSAPLPVSPSVWAQPGEAAP